MTGLAAMFKQTGVLNLLFFGLYELIEAYRARRGFQSSAAWLKASSKQLIARLSLIALGFLLVIAAFIGWLASMHALADFWRNSVEINMFYIDSEPANLWWRFTIGRGLGYVLFNFVLWSFAAWTVARSIKAARQAAMPDRENGDAASPIIGNDESHPANPLEFNLIACSCSRMQVAWGRRRTTPLEDAHVVHEHVRDVWSRRIRCTGETEFAAHGLV